MRTQENKEAAQLLIDSIRQQTKKLWTAEVQTTTDFNRLQHLKRLMRELQDEFGAN